VTLCSCATRTGQLTDRLYDGAAMLNAVSFVGCSMITVQLQSIKVSKVKQMWIYTVHHR